MFKDTKNNIDSDICFLLYWLTTVLTHSEFPSAKLLIINHCIRTSTLPAKWKLSNLTPVFQKDDVTLVSNYRPISIFSAKS